jgi:hypothetical protein
MTPPETATTERPQTKPFAQFVQEQRSGGLHGEASEMLAELVAAVQQHGKSGSLTLEVKVAPGEAPGTLVVRDVLKAKLPEAEKSASLFFADDHGNLSRRDPRQPELPLRPAPAPSASDTDEGARGTG